MFTADSLSNLLQKVYDTLPLDQRASGAISIETFVNALLPVLAINATPERDKIIAAEVCQASALLGVGETFATFDTDIVPDGELHRFLAGTVKTDASAVNSAKTLITYSLSGTVIPRIGYTIAEKEIQPNLEVSLWSPADVLAGVLSRTKFVPGLPFIDVYPGGNLETIVSDVSNGITVIFKAMRIRMHGPRGEKINDFTPLVKVKTA